MKDVLTPGLTSYDRARALGLHRAFTEAAKKRLFPIFDNIEAESDAAWEAEYQDLCGKIDWEHVSDPSGIFDSAMENAVEEYEELVFVKGQVLALATAALYHLWERTFKDFMLRVYEIFPEPKKWKDKFERANFKDIKDWLTDWGYENAPFEELKILSLVANTAKHGDGDSCRKLAEVEPELLRGPYGKDLDFVNPNAENLWITPERFERFSNAVTAFWSGVPRMFTIRLNKTKTDDHS